MIIFRNLSMLFKEFEDLFFQKRKNIIWGNSRYKNFGPGIRTRRLEYFFKNISLKNKIIYMQSHWPWYELIFTIILSKVLIIPIVFNQNGIYKKSYKKTYWLNNILLIFSILNSRIIIYQSRYCKEAIKKITNKLIWNLISKRENHIILNPCPDQIKNKKINKLKHNLVISNCFSKDRKYYAEYVCKLVNKIKTLNNINKIYIIGPLEKILDYESKHFLEKSRKVTIYGYLEQKDLFKILQKSTIGIHLNYADPCPNMVCEYMSNSIPVIVNSVGGAKEIAKDAGIFPRNTINLDHNEMPDIKDVLICLKKIINNYQIYYKNAKDRALKLSIENYANKHIKIFSSL